jgi:23S rRNA (guanine745-N1)-methyltransferase
VLSDVCDLLACPLCGSGFRLLPSALRCRAGHSFDIARQGYVNLMPGGARPGTADTAEMIAAREEFLSAGHYAPLARMVADLAGAAVPPAPAPASVLDAGAGTGYYLGVVLDRLGSRPSAPAAVGLAMDISARALRRAARAHPAIGAVVCDLWKPFPVRSCAASLIINVFAPRNGAEFRRVLRADGALIVVTPAPGHLAELIRAAELLTVDSRKDERLAASLAGHFTLASRAERAFGLRLSRAGAATLIGMGPSARHADAAVIHARLARLAEPIAVTAAFQISVYRPR